MGADEHEEPPPPAGRVGPPVEAVCPRVLHRLACKAAPLVATRHPRLLGCFVAEAAAAVGCAIRPFSALLWARLDAGTGPGPRGIFF